MIDSPLARAVVRRLFVALLTSLFDMPVASLALARSPIRAPLARPLHRARASVSRVVARRAAPDAREEDDEEVGAAPSPAMLEFAEAGFPSDEDDVLDPRARDRAMNRVVDEIHELNKAEEEVLAKAFELVEKFGLKRRTTGA